MCDSLKKFYLICHISNRTCVRTTDTAEVIGCTIVGAGLWLATVTFNRYTLKFLFRYHGWMYESHGKASLTSKIWAVSYFFLLKEGRMF